MLIRIKGKLDKDAKKEIDMTIETEYIIYMTNGCIQLLKGNIFISKETEAEINKLFSKGLDDVAVIDKIKDTISSEITKRLIDEQKPKPSLWKSLCNRLKFFK